MDNNVMRTIKQIHDAAKKAISQMNAMEEDEERAWVLNMIVRECNTYESDRNLAMRCAESMYDEYKRAAEEIREGRYQPRQLIATNSSIREYEAAAVRAEMRYAHICELADYLGVEK